MSFLVNPFWASTNTGGANALNARFDTTNTTTSTTFVDVLSPTGGSAVTVSLTKQLGASGILISASVGCSVGAAADIVLGVNDGTTDWEINHNRLNSTSDAKAFGTRVLTGLSAGSYTFTLRFRSKTGASIGTGSSDNLFLLAMELDA